ncbi:type II restriction endonuclease [Lacrimispora algidixylanolytica]|uniref:Restriction endonuclease n=1 Tax=Lacrimispora algidixylanolytica TaxID=94868 RepID=A0A419SYR1_9FIRM|nr:type II restriction endonuclease [Lacrimispora algidixylanolytica]RKD30299.1 restriction endonuclease [Lacrimispora algidixylanolytica]
MISEILKDAIESVESSGTAFCKFLSANDTGATGGHQSGILVSASAKSIMFSEKIPLDGILKRDVKIFWHNDFYTESTFTYYSSKKELRITKFGRKFPLLRPEQTGALFVFTKQSEDEFSGYILEMEEDIEEFLETFGISSTETNCLFGVGSIQQDRKESLEIYNYIKGLNVEFPETGAMSKAAQSIANEVYNHIEYLCSNPDKKIIEWMNVEYSLFRAIEQSRYGSVVNAGFSSVEDFVKLANTVLNRRKSRAGKSLEHHLEAIFDANEIRYSSQAVTEGNKKPDFVFPSQEAYQDMKFSTEKLVSLAAKTTCKDRWRQVLNEANRLRDKDKFLCTLQQGISPAQMDEMQEEQVILVVPKQYISCYPKDRQDRIWTISRFVRYVKELQNL